jgi:hypothetical protein
MDFLQQNKFGELHNGKNIYFCKTEFLTSEFKKIGRIKNQFILISGNSDEGIDSKLIVKMPDNILAWYGQNVMTYHEKLRSIPIGLENTFQNKRKKHGIGWDHAISKIALLNTINNNNDPNNNNAPLPQKILYANFNIQTNIAHRSPIKEACKKSPFITWDEPTLNYNDFIANVLDHEATVCPMGNGLDTHRLYEILYCNRVAITIKAGNYPIYTDLYPKLPVVVLDSIDELYDIEKIKELIAAAKHKTQNIELLDFHHWKNTINDVAANIVIEKRTFFN